MQIGKKNLSWSKLDFSKHCDKTLPQVLFKDPDWFFWSIDEGVWTDKPYFRSEAEDINRKARRIKIPNNEDHQFEVEYFTNPTVDKFSHFEIIPRTRGYHQGGSSAYRSSVIGMSFPRQMAPYDKTGCALLLQSLREHVFGDATYKFTKKRCESFFSDPDNFA